VTQTHACHSQMHRPTTHHGAMCKLTWPRERSSGRGVMARVSCDSRESSGLSLRPSSSMDGRSLRRCDSWAASRSMSAAQECHCIHWTRVETLRIRACHIGALACKLLWHWRTPEHSHNYTMHVNTLFVSCRCRRQLASGALSPCRSKRGHCVAHNSCVCAYMYKITQLCDSRSTRARCDTARACNAAPIAIAIANHASQPQAVY
jgi:hypothetical protein